jgi:hypothetical protein
MNLYKSHLLNGYSIVTLKKFDYKEIGYYGNPLDSLTKEELLEAFAKLAAIIYECSVNDKKLKEFIFIKKGESTFLENTKRTK